MQEEYVSSITFDVGERVMSKIRERAKAEGCRVGDIVGLRSTSDDLLTFELDYDGGDLGYQIIRDFDASVSETSVRTATLPCRRP